MLYKWPEKQEKEGNKNAKVFKIVEKFVEEVTSEGAAFWRLQNFANKPKNERKVVRGTQLIREKQNVFFGGKIYEKNFGAAPRERRFPDKDPKFIVRGLWHLYS